MLVGKLYPYPQTFACVVDIKSGTDGYAVDRLSKFIRTSGHSRFVYKTDQESSVKHLMSEALVKDNETLLLRRLVNMQLTNPLSQCRSTVQLESQHRMPEQRSGWLRISCAFARQLSSPGLFPECRATILSSGG